MTNTIKKSLVILAALVMAGFSYAQNQTVKTYDFSSANALDDWTFTVENPKNGTAKYEITSSLQSLNPGDGSYVGFSFLNQSKIRITMTSKESFKNISNIFIS